MARENSFCHDRFANLSMAEVEILDYLLRQELVLESAVRITFKHNMT